MSLNPYSPPNPLPDEDPPLVAQLAVDGEGMTVEFEQTLDDLVTFHDSHLRQQPFYRRHRLAIVAVVAVGVGWLLLPPAGVFPARDQSAAWLLLLAGIIYLAIWLYQQLGRRFVIRRNLERAYSSSKKLNVLGGRRITITPEFVISASPLSQSANRWAGIEKVVADERALLIYDTSITAHIVPRRAFVSDQHFHDFASQAAKYLAAAGRGV